MNFTRIKDLVKGNGERLIFMENGEPEAVVMSFDEYAKMAGAAHAPHAEQDRSGAALGAARRAHAADEPLDLPSYEEDPWEPDDMNDMGGDGGVYDTREADLAPVEGLGADAAESAPDARDIRLEDLPI